MKRNVRSMYWMAGYAVALGVGTIGGSAITVTPTSNAADLAAAILGPGVMLIPGTAQFIGASPDINIPGSAGRFTGGNTIPLGFNSGIVLTSGDSTIAGLGVNISQGSGRDNGLPGDAALTALAGDQTYDATKLKFQFKISDTVPGNLFFNYVFASEEYNEWVNQFNDVFAFYLDGKNIALLQNGAVVDIDNVNNSVNSSFYRDNRLGETLSTPGTPGPYLTEYDGLTTMLTAQALNLAPGTHTIELAISDTRDGVLDSAVFIQGGSFDTQPTPGDPVPDAGSTTLLLGLALLGLPFARKRE